MNKLYKVQFPFINFFCKVGILILFVIGYIYNYIFILSFAAAVTSVVIPEMIFRKITDFSYGKTPREINNYMYLGSFSKYVITILALTLILLLSPVDPTIFIISYVICKFFHVIILNYMVS
jgi:hypothetical protein